MYFFPLEEHTELNLTCKNEPQHTHQKAYKMRKVYIPQCSY